MTRLIDDYLREVERTLTVDAARKRQIIAELRSHLQEKIDEAQRDDPGAPLADVERTVLGEMGSPTDLALAYEPDGSTVLRRSTGDTVLHVGSAVGRGLGRFLKWAAVILVVLVVLAVGIGFFAMHELRPYASVFANDGSPVYSFQQSCEGTPCNGLMPSDTFFVPANTTALRFSVDLYHGHDPRTDDRIGNGSVHVVVRDPNNVTRLDRAFNMTNASSLSTEQSWEGIAGDWSVSIEYTGFQGELVLAAHTRSPLP